jgi:hypothetical protein
VRQQEQKLLAGFPAIGGRAEVQKDYYRWDGSMRNGKQGLAELLEKLSAAAWDQWEHTETASFMTKKSRVSKRI